jgi:uncharacterized protein YecE (DUF72 family)
MCVMHLPYQLHIPLIEMANAYIGTSGWNYKHWSNGEFYPKDIKPADWLKFYVERFETVEINNSFYRLPSEAAFQSWRKQVPQEFVFAVKASRFLTHIKRLKEPEAPLELFFSRAKHLEGRLGPVLFQLPPQMKMDLERLETFLRALKPHMKKLRVRCVIEFRDATWLVPPIFDLLREHRVGLCFADWRETHVTEPITADFVYVRRHYGSAGGGNYSKKDLAADVQDIRAWLRRGFDVYMYFNNDMGGHAVRNAMYVQQALVTAGSDRRRRGAGSARRHDSLKWT